MRLRIEMCMENPSVILSTGVTAGGLAYRLKSGAANQQPSAVE